MSSDMRAYTGSIILLLVCLVQGANCIPTVVSAVHQLCEDIEIGQHAFDIQASDPEGDALTYRISDFDAAVFEVTDDTGRVTVKGALDRENKGSLKFNAYASDGKNEGRGMINIIVLDVNDERPEFLDPSYDKSVPENTPIDELLFKVSATDADEGDAGAVRYQIDEVTPGHGFEMFSIGRFNGEVKLTGRLNYTSLSTFYRIKINASDGGGSCGSRPSPVQSNSVFSYITVEDVADLDPLFINTPYTQSVQENSAVDTSVFKVSAIDQDKGINDDMIYTIEDSKPPGLFKISQNDGVISVSSGIDREVTGDTVSLTLKATEANVNIHGLHASTTTTMKITILDVNDNPPEFYECTDSCVKKTEFTGDVLENSLGFISFNMTVIDPDKDVNTKLSLEGEDKDVFSVEPSTAVSDTIVQLRVRQPEKLDFEQKQQMVLQVIAEDMDKPSFRTVATVTINIQDANDNSPTFPQVTYELEVPEHSPDGTNLTHITAEDPDTMDQGNITYKLLPESILPMFDVDPNSGTVYVKNGALLDREVRSLYSATLQARDSDNKPGSTVLEITLTDINDQPPVINRASYQEYVKEGDKFEYRIEATDRDEDGSVNSQIVFSVEPNQYSNNFTIDENTGWLRNKGELDLEWLDPELNGRIELNVTATDKGTPPLSSTVPFIIILEDVNDNTPKFEEIAYNFSINEGEKGAFVGSVHAEDRDQTSIFNRISFRITSGGLGSFSIIASAADEGYVGKISVDQDVELEYETEHTRFQLQVEASDTDSKKSVVTVEVNVLDVNDERPEFLLTDPVTVKENTTISKPVGRFVAQDKDTNHSLIYKQESVKCRCNNTLKQCDWFIVDQTGEVSVNPKEMVDYEQCDQAVIEAQVEDEYTEKGEKDSVKPGLMVINIEDINDNAPQFFYSDTVFVVVAEGSNKDTSVAHVTASDKDSGENRKIEFKVKTVQFRHSDNRTENLRLLFEAVTTQQDNVFVGNIQSNTGLNVDLTGTYLVTVTATDTGGLETSTVVEIFTVDQSYKVILEFLLSEAELDQKLDEIKRVLMSATSAVVDVVDIKPASGGTSKKEVEKTVIVAYFIFRNGTALTRNEVESMLSVGEHFVQLKQLGLNTIGTGVAEAENTSPVVFILLGVVAGLIIVLTILTTSLMCTRRNYRRRLKASNAMNTASMVNSDNQKGGAVVPGTNKYTMEGANPVLNLHIDTTVALDLDGESSDMDKVSLNSLDDHYDSNSNDTNDDMQRIREEEEDDGPPEYNEPLSAALAQLGPKKTAKTSNVGFNNPIFDTTDL